MNNTFYDTILQFRNINNEQFKQYSINLASAFVTLDIIPYVASMCCLRICEYRNELLIIDA